MVQKRKTVGGRTTAKGTQPGDRRVLGTDTGGSRPGPAPSSRYTPPSVDESKLPIPWIPYLMLALLGLGVVVIMLRNLVWESNWLTLVGLVCILGGLYTATKWR